ncbi:MAG: aminotransferase class I/II-fold pyridoxal phosphate-dependent enzyme [Synergistaceae bacterium]|nr:aminotransferase class I/II-fold pyridoxal phosphate-dependent enzyme [Synergistaceae bacterium]
MRIEDLVKPGIRNIPPYIPGRASESTLLPGVAEILQLGSNENQLGTSPMAIEAMQKAIKLSNCYPDPFCAGIRSKIGKLYGFEEEPESHVVISAGGIGALRLIGDVFLEPGDEVVYCAPSYDVYGIMAARSDAKAVKLPLDRDQRFDLDAIAQAVNERTKLVIICNPNNPSSTAVDAGALRRFIRQMPRNAVTVVDEAYIDFADDPGSMSMVSEIAEGVNLIVLRTFSKMYGLAGARIAFGLTNKEIHNVLQRSTDVFVVSRAALAAADAALDDHEFVERSRAAVVEGRSYLTAEFESMGMKVYRSQANFVYVDTGYDTSQLASACMQRGLVIRGNFLYSRITIGTDRQNRRAAEIIREVIASGEVVKNR